MTEQPTDAQAKAAQVGRNDDFRAVDYYAPPRYKGLREGAGRWCWIQRPIGVRVGVLWTDDGDGLGFLGEDALVNPSAPYFVSRMAASLSAAAGAGVTATVVFDAWAARATQGLAAEPVQATSNLADLKDVIR